MGKALKERSIKFNFIMNTILTVSSMIFPLITFKYVSGIIGAAGTGAVSFVYSIVSYFSMFAQMGVPTYGIRACARVREDREELSRTVQEILIINLVTCALSYLCFAAGLMCVPAMREEKKLFLIMGSLIFFNTIGVDWLYRGMEQYSYITVRSLICRLIALVAVFLLIREKDDYVLYGALYIFAAVGSNILNFLNLRKLITVKPVGNYCFRRHFRPIAAFFAMSVATTIYTNLDNTMIGLMKGKTENGYYDAAVKVKVALVNFVTSLGTVLLPRVSYYIEKKMDEEFRRISKKALEFIMLTASPLVVYFIYFARPSVLLLSDAGYLNAVTPMRLIMPTLLFIGLSNILGIQMLVPMGKEKTVLISEIVGAVVDIIVNAALIPTYGAAGAAVGTTVAELAVLLVQLAALRRMVIPELMKIPYWKIAAAISAACVSVCWVSGLQLGSFLTLLISAVIFFGCYVLVLCLLKEQFVLEYLRQIRDKIDRKTGRK